MIEYAGSVDPRPVDGRADDRLQHVDRGRRARRPDRARRDDVRLSRGPPDGAEGRRLGAGRRLLAHAARPTRARRYDTEVALDAADDRAAGHLGHPPAGRGRRSPAACPTPKAATTEDRRRAMERSLEYMGLEPGTPMSEVKVDKRLHRLLHQRPHRGPARRRQAGRRASTSPPASSAMVVPGSGLVKHQAEEEGLDRIFTEAGFEWREAGCSMCLGMNPDKLKPGERCASTSNRNFEGRQGKGGRTHLVSPRHGRGGGDHGPSGRRAQDDLRRHWRGRVPDLGCASPASPAWRPAPRAVVDAEHTDLDRQFGTARRRVAPGSPAPACPTYAPDGPPRGCRPTCPPPP